MWTLLWLACAPAPDRLLVFDRVDGDHQLVPRALPWLDDPRRLTGRLGDGSFGGAPDLQEQRSFLAGELTGLPQRFNAGGPLHIAYAATDGVGHAVDEQGTLLWSFYHHLGAAEAELAEHDLYLDDVFPLRGIAYAPRLPVSTIVFDNAAYVNGYHWFFLLPDSIRDLPFMANVGVARHELTHAWFARMGSNALPITPSITGINEGFADIVAALSTDDPYFIEPSLALAFRDARKPGVTLVDALQGPDVYVLGMVYASMVWAFREAQGDRWAVLAMVVDVVPLWLDDAQVSYADSGYAAEWELTPTHQELGERLLAGAVGLPGVDSEIRASLCDAFDLRFSASDARDLACP